MEKQTLGKRDVEMDRRQIREHGIPKYGRPKKGSRDTDFDGLADALLIRAERVIAELELNDRATQLPHPAYCVPGCEVSSP
jgi:hypothetical protein